MTRRRSSHSSSRNSRYDRPRDAVLAHDGADHRPWRSRAFYEALGFTLAGDFDIVRDGEVEATNYFFSLGEQDSVLELTYNQDGRTYDLGTGYGHIAVGVDDLDATLERLREQGSCRSASRTRSAKAARDCASSGIRTSTGRAHRARDLARLRRGRRSVVATLRGIRVPASRGR